MSASADRVHASREEINIHRIYYKCLTTDMINRIYIFIYSGTAGRNTGIRCHFNLMLDKVEIHKWRICVHLLIWGFRFVLFYVWFSNFKVAQSMRFKHKVAQSCEIKHKVARSCLHAVLKPEVCDFKHKVAQSWCFPHRCIISCTFIL